MEPRSTPVKHKKLDDDVLTAGWADYFERVGCSEFVAAPSEAIGNVLLGYHSGILTELLCLLVVPSAYLPAVCRIVRSTLFGEVVKGQPQARQVAPSRGGDEAPEALGPAAEVPRPGELGAAGAAAAGDRPAGATGAVASGNAPEEAAANEPWRQVLPSSVDPRLAARMGAQPAYGDPVGQTRGIDAAELRRTLRRLQRLRWLPAIDFRTSRRTCDQGVWALQRRRTPPEGNGRPQAGAVRRLAAAARGRGARPGGGGPGGVPPGLPRSCAGGVCGAGPAVGDRRAPRGHAPRAAGSGRE
ncbi:unnamed protein product, partial [Prorocentrum cordatum]